MFVEAIGTIASLESRHCNERTCGILGSSENAPKCERPPQPFLTVPIASRVDLVHPVFKKACHGQAGESGEGTGVAEAVAAV